MASVTEMIRLYVDETMSLAEVAAALGKGVSTVRYHLSKAGVLRTKREADALAGAKGKKSTNAGQSRSITDEAKAKMRDARLRWSALHAKLLSKKPSGYLEYTTGEHKGRSFHTVLLEKHLGRRLFPNEVVHHIDHDRTNNALENLQLLTRAEHASLHAAERVHLRIRDEKGRFI